MFNSVISTCQQGSRLKLALAEFQASQQITCKYLLPFASQMYMPFIFLAHIATLGLLWYCVNAHSVVGAGGKTAVAG